MPFLRVGTAGRAGRLRLQGDTEALLSSADDYRCQLQLAFSVKGKIVNVVVYYIIVFWSTTDHTHSGDLKFPLPNGTRV